jgi:curved DNA-binding protein CbpA
MRTFMIDLKTQSHYSELGIGPDAGAKDIRDSQSRIIGELRRKLSREGNPDEKRAIDERMKSVNSIGDKLSNPKERQAYDAANSHLTFFVIRKASAPILEDRELRLRWIHKAVRDFLVERGETVAPLADLERSDFSADCTPNQMLDDILESKRRG